MGPEATIAIELFGLFCIVCLTLARVWIQRNRVRTATVWAYEICLWCAFATNVYITSIDVWSSWRETRLPPGLSQQETALRLMDSTFMKCFFAVGISYTCFLWFVKGSFIALYFELSGHLVHKVQIALYCVTAFVVSTYIANIILKFVWCMPFHRNWSTGPDRCTFAIALPVNTCTAMFNIATDLALLGLFILIVYSLQLRNRELLAAIFVGFVGSCTVIAAAVRFGVAYTAFKDSKASWRNTKLLLLWTNIEMGLVLLAVSLPAFRTLFRNKNMTSSNSRGLSVYASKSADGRFKNKAIQGNITLSHTELSNIGTHSSTAQVGRDTGSHHYQHDQSDESVIGANTLHSTGSQESIRPNHSWA